jgi:2-keto-4-pentenoate hydratase
MLKIRPYEVPEVSKVNPSNLMYFAPLKAAVKLAVVDEDVGAKVTTGDVLLLGSL